MKLALKPNIGTAGRIARGLAALILLLAAWRAGAISPWLSLALACAGAFVMFEALHGWCALRACGIKTKI
jgi:heme A synthase